MITTRYQKITIISSRRPRHDINVELQWFGNSLGLFNLRDKDKSCFRIFIELLKSTKIKKPLSSDEIADKLDLSRGTVMHHINKLLESGIVVIEDNKYILRVDNLEVLIDELEKDIGRMLSELRTVAKDIDKHLAL
jgi:predicted transcriptional regulator